MKRIDSFLSADQQHSIHLVWWLCDHPKGTIQLVHGMNEYIERYDAFAQAMNEAGYVVVGHDHLGHGLSVKASERGHFKNQWLIEDIHQVAQMVNPHLPHILLGHSMGSFLVRQYLCLYHDVDKAIIMGSCWQAMPLLYFAKGLSHLIGLLRGRKRPSQWLHQLAIEGYNRPFGPYGWLSRDEAIVQAFQHDSLTQFHFTNGAYEQMFKGLVYAQKHQHAIQSDLPILIISGLDDPVGRMGKGVKALYKRFKQTHTQVSLILYPGMRHEILNEIGKEQVYADLLAFIS